MKTMKLAIVTAACALAACNVANAAWSGVIGTGGTFSSDVGLAPTGGGRINFDDLPLGSADGTASGPNGSVGVSFISDGQTVVGAVSGGYAAPVLSGGNGNGFGPGSINQALGTDQTRYLTTGTGSATLTFGSAQTYLGLLWGSVDTYNTLSFYNGLNLVGSLTGGQVFQPAKGAQDASGTVYVNISGITFNQVVASSTSYAFEFDNVAVVPEPTTMIAGALLLLPFGASTLRSLRRKA